MTTMNMKKTRVFITVSLLLILNMLLSFSFAEKKDILYISSYSPSFETFNDQIAGIKSVLKSEDYVLSIQYMDSKDHYSLELIDNFREQLVQKMEMTNFDAVVVADDNAYDFALEEKDDLFKNLPIIFLGVNNQSNALKANTMAEVTGVIEEVSLEETIEIGLTLQREAKNVYLIADPTPTGQSVLKVATDLIKKDPTINFRVLDASEMTFESLAKALEAVPSNDLIILLSLYRDQGGNSLVFLEGVDFVLRNSHAPVFHIYKPGIEEGLIGGNVVDHYSQGYQAGLLVEKFFEKGTLAEILVIEESPNAYYFNVEAMKNYGLDPDSLPKDAILINQDLNVFERYRNYIITFGLLFIFEGFLIFYLIYNLKKRRAYEKELIKTNDLLETSYEEITAQYSELEDTKKALDISRSRYILAFEGANSGMFDHDFKKDEFYINAQWYNQYLEEPLEDTDDFSSFLNLMPDDKSKAYQSLKNEILKGDERRYGIEFFIASEDSNDEQWFLENGVIVRDENGNVTRIIGTHREITHLKQNIKRIKDLKVYDQLTKLYNRNALEVHLKEMLAREENHPIAIILIDLDDFKYINDQYGHHVGDEILKTLANRMMQNNVADYISRFGGDEFVLLLNNIESIEALINRLYEINYLIERKISIASDDYHMEASLGIALAPEHGNDCHELIRKADLAMYHVKNFNNNTWYQIYEEGINENFEKKIKMIQNIKSGIKNNEFYMVFQPVVDAISGDVFAVEALMRWESQGEMVSPNEFIPLAEENALIYELGLVSIIESIKCLKATGGAFNVSINLSPMQLKNPKIIDVLEKTIEAYSVPYERLIIEVTETAVIEDFDVTIKVLEHMKNLGFRIAFDDFGTGYSSLSYLTKLPVDILKIDKDFVQSINESEENMALIKAIVTIANSRNLRVVFEGVETKEQLNYIIRLGCRYVQGYYYFKPLTLKALEKYI